MTIFTDLVSVTELQALMASGRSRIVDCRFNLMHPDSGRKEYHDGHIPGSVYAHLDDDLAGPVTAASGRHPLPDPEMFVQTAGQWGIDNETQVVVYDHANGAIAARLWWLLRWLGHNKVAVLDGGMSAWTGAGGELETKGVEFTPRTFVGTPDPSLVATTDEIAAAVAAGDELNLVDARDAPRFDGEMEPIDTVAGHIPGALNMPFVDGVGPDGVWLSVEHHGRRWDKLLSGRPERPLITMCGSGVTACHLLLSARLSGRPEPRLYVGSWSEWIRDEKRPVATAK